MSIIAPAVELEQGYEALRAQAVGEIPRRPPRGLAVLSRGGLLAWMCACPPPPPTPVTHARLESGNGLGTVSGDVVRLLAEMVLSHHRRRVA